MSNMSENSTPPIPPAIVIPPIVNVDPVPDSPESINNEAKKLKIQQPKKIAEPGQKSGLSGNHGASPVWFHFLQHKKDGKYIGKATCNYCQTDIDAPSKRGTTKLWNHLNRCRLFKDSKVDKQQGCIAVKVDGAPYNWKFDGDESRRCLVRMVILCELPFSFVEKVAFKLFCYSLQPRFNGVGRTTVTQDCLRLFDQEKQNLKQVFKVLCTRVCLTTDMWTSIQNLPYMAVTAHYVDKNWTIQKRIIAFRQFPHPHNGINIAKALEATLLEWELTKVFTITLDNASNNDVAVADLKLRLNRRKAFFLSGSFFHIRCFAHVLNLVVRAGLENSIGTVKRLRRSVKYVRSSPSRFQSFKLCARDEGIITKKYLCLDVKTRWNSTYLMINSALGFRKAFERMEDQDSFYKDQIDGVLDSDWNKLESLHVFLEEFYEITMRVSGSRYVTSTTYMEEIKDTKDLLDKHLKSTNEDLHDMAMLMNAKFEKYCKFEDINMILIAAMVLDPRNKMQYARWIFMKYFHEDLVDGLVSNLKDFMLRLYNEYKAEFNASSGHSGGMDRVVTEGNLSTTGANKRTSDREEFKRSLKEAHSFDEKNDLDKYLADGVEDGDQDFNILEWWRGKAATYRALALMARDILAIPVTSVASECAFSTAKRVLDPFRSSLTPVTTEALLCTQDWLKAALSESEILDEKLERLEQIEQDVIKDIASLSLSKGSPGSSFNSSTT